MPTTQCVLHPKTEEKPGPVAHVGWKHPGLTCHLHRILDWTNFEIGDLDFFRESEGYNKYFEHLDAAGGFYYEVYLL